MSVNESPSIRVEELGKAYKHYATASDRIYDWLTFGWLRRPTLSWPVQGISFQVQAGEAVGIIGENGAGKTTLMNLIRGVVFPTTGAVHIHGSLSALDLGLGFHADFTGRQNLFAGGALLGISAKVVEEQLSEIEAFAEIGDYLDRPVRTYSSGMRLRLAFSLATTIRPDILVIDEALAVGDAYFQQKCVRRIREFRSQGTTLLLVSHDQAAIKTLCDRVLLLDRGLLVQDGRPQDVLEYYNGLIARTESDYSIRQKSELGEAGGTTRHGDSQAVIDSVEICKSDVVTRVFVVGAGISIRVRGHAEVDLDDLTVGILFRDRLGNNIFGTNTHHLGTAMKPIVKGQDFEAKFSLPLNLGVGNYSISASLHAGEAHILGNYDWWDGIETIQVLPGREGQFAGCCYIETQASFEADCPNRVDFLDR
jgi:lipopolysaccharide transport system ATP-binding protein